MLKFVYIILFFSCIRSEGNFFLNDINKKQTVHTQTDVLNSRNDIALGTVDINIYQKSDISNIIHYLPSNYSTRGDIDYTKYLQLAFNENNAIVLPNFPIAVNFNGVVIPSNRTVTFQQNSMLIVLPNDQPKYQALLVSNVRNVKIINPNLRGERYQHMNSKGEWGMGINILSSSNVTIINPNIKNFWGDGIYIGRTGKHRSYCSKVNISGGVLDNNRRNGISIISGKDITIKNIVIKNTNGTNPMAGIDLEPNLSDEFLYNINLNNIQTVNNKVDGIKVVFHKFKKTNNVLVNIDGHSDDGSTNPLTLVGVDNVNTGNFSGTLNYTNSKWNNTKSNIRLQRMLSPRLKLNIKPVKINGLMMDKSLGR